MLFFYRIAILSYLFIVRVAALFKPKAKLFIDGRKGLLLNIKAQMGNENRPKIWFHCSSLGEFEQGRPVLEYIRNKYPQYAIVLTFFSPSGYQVRKNYEAADYIFYLPIDTARNAKQFVFNINPEFAVFVKYDLWYYYLSELKKANIPCVLIDAIYRNQQGYFKWYGAIQRKMLQLVSHIFAQNEGSLQLLKSINVNHVTVAGDTRFDRVLTVAQNANSINRIENLAEHYQLIIAGSTWKEDEQMLAQFLPHLPTNWKLIIVPHDVDEQRISSVEKTFNGQTTRWSSWQGQQLETPVLVVDTIGLLLNLYRYGNLAWIGGGLSTGGVHNVLEAAVYGLPCAFGPEYQKYQEAIELIACDAALCCRNAKEFNSFFSALLNSAKIQQDYSSAAKNFVAQRGGATDIIVRYLEEKNWLKTL